MTLSSQQRAAVERTGQDVCVVALSQLGGRDNPVKVRDLMAQARRLTLDTVRGVTAGDISIRPWSPDASPLGPNESMTLSSQQCAAVERTRQDVCVVALSQLNGGADWRGWEQARRLTLDTVRGVIAGDISIRPWSPEASRSVQTNP